MRNAALKKSIIFIWPELTTIPTVKVFKGLYPAGKQDGPKTITAHNGGPSSTGIRSGQILSAVRFFDQP